MLNVKVSQSTLAHHGAQSGLMKINFNEILKGSLHVKFIGAFVGAGPLLLSGF